MRLRAKRSPGVVEVVEDARGFAALEGEWAGLYEDSPGATPFQSWEWLYSWWEHYGREGGGYALRLVAVRGGGGLLVGLLPLMLERRRGGFGRLLFLGTGVTDYLDVLARGGWEGEVGRAGAEALGGMGGWQVADLQELRPGAAAWGLVGRWPGPKATTWQSDCPVVEAKSWDETLSALGRKQRYHARRAVRRAEADGLRRELAGEAEAEGAARRLVALHREAWRGRGIGPEHLAGRFEGHIVAAARRMIARELGAISEFRQEGEAIASLFAILGNDFVGAYLTGATRGALRRYQVSSLYIWDGVKTAGKRDVACLDLLRGGEPYKLRWNPKLMPNYRAIMGRNLVLWGPYAGYQIMHSQAKRYAGSENAPQWAKSAADHYRALRRAINRLQVREAALAGSLLPREGRSGEKTQTREE